MKKQRKEEVKEPGSRCEQCNDRFSCFAQRNHEDTKWICVNCAISEGAKRYVYTRIASPQPKEKNGKE